MQGFGKPHWVRPKAHGGSGGVWLLWDQDEIAITQLWVDKSFIHILVSIAGGMRWELTTIYASPKVSIRRDLWGKLNEINKKDPWMIRDDFNCVLKGEERSLGDGVSSFFIEWVDHNGLIDLGFIGQAFTWKHGNSAETRKAARLDRGLCDSEWRRLFPVATIKHLPHGYSDHCPLLLQLQATKEVGLGTRPFSFQAAWMLHSNFYGWLEREWDWEGCLSTALRNLSSKLVAWNRDTSGNIFRRKKRNLLWLAGVQRALGSHVSERLLKLEENLKEETNLILLHEELL